METSSSSPFSFPFEIEEKTIGGPYLNVTLKLRVIEDENEETLESRGQLLLTSSRFCFLGADGTSLFFFGRYYNCISHGNQGTSLMCLVSDILSNEQEVDILPISCQAKAEEMPQSDSEESHSSEKEEIETTTQFIFQELKSRLRRATVDPKMMPLELKGEFQVFFDLSESPNGKSEDVFQVFSHGSSMNPDPPGYKSDFDQMDFFENEFYTSADIDEHGNIKKQAESPEEADEESKESQEENEKDNKEVKEKNADES